ncbi:MAG: FAD:protein FMN transferase [Candidatus Saccharimonas sp.]
MVVNPTYEFDAIGTHWWCEILDPLAGFTDELKTAIIGACDQFDARYSRFRDDSFVAQLAKTGALHRPPHELIAMLDTAKEMEHVSEGTFTIGVGPALHAFGYGSRSHGGPVAKNIWQHIDYNSARVRIPKGLMLDFGGLGKGWLIDSLVTILRHYNVKQFIVNGGGDLYVQSDSPIEFALEDPYDAAKKIGQTTIANGALAASSTIKRTWASEAGEHHHIIDPATGQSSNTAVVASFVKAKTALLADCMATILILRPDLETVLSQKYGLETILITQN